MTSTKPCPMTISRASIFDGDHERKAGASDGYYTVKEPFHLPGSDHGI